MKLFKRKASYIIILLSVLALASCGGGGGGGGGGLPNPVGGGGGGGGSASVTVNPASPIPNQIFTITVVIPDAVDLYMADFNILYDKDTLELIDTGTLTNSILSGVLPTFDASHRIPATTFDPADPNLMATFYDTSSGSFQTWTGTDGTICVITFRMDATAVSGTATKVVLAIKYRFGASGTTEQSLTSTNFINIS